MPLKPHPTDPDKMVYVSRKYDDDDIQEYVRPWRGLTDEEINALDYSGTRIEFVRAIEAKLKEKNI